MNCAGLIGGMSWESTALYYQWINEGVRERLGGLHSAQLVLHSVDFAEIEALQRVGDWDTAADHILVAAESVQAAGAEFLVLCTNTMHKVAPLVESRVQLPLLHIVDPTAEAIKSKGIQRIGLLGTGFTMADTFYRERMEARFGLTVLVPSPEQQKEIHRIIYEELCRGVVRTDSLRVYLDVVESLCNGGAEGVILGCTEITLLVKQQHTSVPLFDTTAIHAEAVIDWLLTSSPSTR